LVQGLLRVGRKQDQDGQQNKFEENLKELQVLELKWKMIKAELVCKLFEEQDTVFRSYYKGQVGQQ
jgi:hypothetical protein